MFHSEYTCQQFRERDCVVCSFFYRHPSKYGREVEDMAVQDQVMRIVVSIVVVEVDVFVEPILCWLRLGVGIERILAPGPTESMKVVAQIGVVEFDVVVVRVVWELPSTNRVT
jgi:hypothetical protein